MKDFSTKKIWMISPYCGRECLHKVMPTVGMHKEGCFTERNYPLYYRSNPVGYKRKYNPTKWKWHKQTMWEEAW